jgi:hypothetical protein
MDIDKIKSITAELHEITPDNVVMVGYGLKRKGDQFTNEMSIVFGVTEKKPLDQIPEEEHLPSELEIDGEVIPTDVIETDIPQFLQACPSSFYTWQTTPPANRGLVRPIKGGISITNYTSMNNSAGTLGFVAVDNQTNSLVGVTNAHVIIDNPFTNSARTFNSIATNVAQDIVTQPSSIETGFVNQNNPVGVVKRYYPMLQNNFPNYVDCALLTLNESDINTSTAYQQLGLTGWTAPMDFATNAEIYGMVSSGTPLFSTGRTTGPKGEGDMKLIPYLYSNIYVGPLYNQGVLNLATRFLFCIGFVASASTTPSGSICNYPIAGGDSGSALIGEFNGVRKIVGQVFAGSTAVGYAIPIDNIQTQMDISPYTGQTVNYSNTGATQYHYVAGKDGTVNYTLSGNTFWQVGLDSC